MGNQAQPAIRTDFERVHPELVRRARKYQAAIFSDVAGRRGALDGRIRALGAHMKLCGPAFTVEVRPGDNLMFHAALAYARPGDVIVVDGKGDSTAALCGALMSAQAKAAGFAGFVVDAAVRDADELAGGDFPVFSVGTNPNGPTKRLAGRLNWPISAGGVAIKPGDLIVADADGVVAVGREEVETLLDLAESKLQDEARRLREITDGHFAASWLQDALKAAGVI